MATVTEDIGHKTSWEIKKYANDDDFAANKPYDISKFVGNLSLTEGMTTLCNLLTGTGAETVYSQANTYLGVGDSSAAEDHAQTALQAAVNKLWKQCKATYPQFADDTGHRVVTWCADFTSAEANYAWAEFTVVNATTDAGKNLNRKVSAQGTKTAGQTWTLSISINFG